MIKTRINNEYKDIIKIFGGGTLQKEIIKVWSGEAQEYVYESSVEYTGALPITINANGDVLLDYRIYGADGGVGEQTENLIDASKPDVQQRVELEPNTDYCLCKYTGSGQGGSPSCYVYDENDNKLFGDYILNWVSYSFKNPSNGAYAIIFFVSAAKGKVSFTKGRAVNTSSLYPANYIPYGYKLPMVTTKNLFDPDGTYEANKFKNNDGVVAQYNNAGYYTQYMPINSEDLISVKNARGDNNLTIRLYYYDSRKNWIGRSGGNGYVTDFTETPLAGAAFIQLQLGVPYTANADKIIISQGGTTTPVYIGENQLDAIGEYVDYADYDTQKTIRRIAKIEFDGSETWFTYQNSFYIGVPNYIKSVWGTCAGFSRSSHYAPSLSAEEIGTYCLGGLVQSPNTRWNGNIVINAGMTKTEFIAYLESQAAAGTPVTFWYVVEIPVEEDPPVPLPEIPTIKGETVIDYDGTPKPSQMYVKYRR